MKSFFVPNPRSAIRNPQSLRASALVITLLFVLILTILVLAFTSQVMLERQIAPLHLRNWEARQIALLGADQARQVIQQALAPLDNPFASTTNRPDFFWALAPGRIDLFDFAATSGQPTRPHLRESIALHSGSSGNLVDLNAKNSEGRQPIWQNGPPMPVTWVNVLKNPADTNASATNPIVGRFAFWVDDEGAKVNVNTADGTYNYQPESYGMGTPSAVSLSVFHEADDSAAPGPHAARLIAQSGREIPYASLADVGSRPEQADWAPFFATNSFNFTTHNRSPDFNIFNEPKFQLFPNNLNVPGWTSGNAGANYFVLRNFMIHWPRWRPVYEGGTIPADFPYSNNQDIFALRSIYPTTNQFTDPVRRNVATFMPGYVNLYPGRRDIPDLPGSFAGALISSTNKLTNAGGNFSWHDPSLFAAMTNAANYLTGRDPFGNRAVWPFADTAYYLTNAPSDSKYNLRQIDSITLQIFDFPKQAAMALGSTWRPPTTAPYGILQDRPVRGVNGRFPHMVQVLAVFDYDNSQTNSVTGNLDYGDLQGWIATQNYFPKNLYQPDWKVDGKQVDFGAIEQNFGTTGAIKFGGRYLGSGTDLDSYNLDDRSYGTRGSLLDYNRPGLQDAPEQWSYWNDRLINAKTGTDPTDPSYESGIDFSGQFKFKPGTSTENEDADYRAISNFFETNATGKILGRMIPQRPVAGDPTRQYSHNFFAFYPGASGGHLGSTAPLGAFQTVATANSALAYKTRNRGSPISQIVLEGGLVYRMSETVLFGLSEIIPLDMIRWPLTGNNASVTNLIRTGPIPATHSVIPLHPPGQPIVVDTNGYPTRYVVSKVRDPLVNQLPGDWIPKVFAEPPTINDTKSARYFPIMDGVIGKNLPGNNWGNRNPFNAEPEVEWVDMASMAGTAVQREGFNASTNWFNTPPQQSFPSVGYLQYLRTGSMPDNPDAVAGDADYAGMPFRLLNFGPANTQGSIPDWAMLDLFTVPNAVWTKPASKLAYGPGEVPRLINLTYGGASSGKINLNGGALFPWAATNAAYVRPMPLAAQFYGLRYNTSGVVNTRLVRMNNGDPYPGNVGIPNTTGQPRLETLASSWAPPHGGVLDRSGAVELAEKIADYIREHGPLSLPGQMCDIPAVNAYGAAIPTQLDGQSLLPPGVTRFYGPNIPNPETPVVNRTRNDIVSQSVGNFVTQGNVFSIWTVGQVIQKTPQNSDYGAFQANDRILGEVRLRVVLERLLDLGEDGVPGNLATPGPDGAVGTPDDPMDPVYHPPNPRFLYRILGVYEVQ